jgi:hypothetical protein
MQQATITALRLLRDTRTPSAHHKDEQPEAPVLDGQGVIFPEYFYLRPRKEEEPKI